MTSRIKWLLFGGLVLIWVTLVFTNVFEDTGPQHMPLKYKSGQTIGETGRKLVAFTKRQTDNAPIMTFKTPRNIFAPLESQTQKPRAASQPTKGQSPSSKWLPSKPLTVQPAPSGPSPEELAANQARQQLAKYQFLGYLTKEGENQVFLSNGHSIYIVKQGETLEGDISILSIQPKAVVLSKPIGHKGMTVEATLPLTKEANGA